MENKILIIVDVQYDFLESGRLPVVGGRRVARSIADFLRRERKKFAAVVCTLDWHPQDHCSFEAQGGTWPKHCTQHSHGASIHNTVMRTLEDCYQDRFFIFEKGADTHREEYSFLQNKDNADRFAQMLKQWGPNAELHVCGVAGDVCVMNTVKDLMRLTDNIVLPPWLGASINEETFKRFIAENKIREE